MGGDYQSGIGARDGGEVTNNVINILSYMAYTNISSYRGYSLSGWNNYLDPIHSINLVNNNTNKNSELEMYVNLINSFGIDKFVEAFKIMTNGNDSNFFKNLVDILGYDMTYYLKELNMLDIDSENLSYAKDKNLEMYVPVASHYQIGVKYNTYNNLDNTYNVTEHFTHQHYKGHINDTYNISDSIKTIEGFNIEIKDVSKPKYGKLIKENNEYIYKPTKEGVSDKFTVRVLVSNNKYSYETTLIIGFDIHGNKYRNKLSSNIYKDLNKDINLDNILEYKELEKEDTFYSNNSNIYLDGTINDILVTKGQFIAKETKEHTFYLAADDKAVLLMGKKRDELKEVAKTTHYTNSYNNELKDSYYKVKLEKGESLFFKIIVLNDGGILGHKLGLEDNDNIIDIPSNMLYNFAEKIKNDYNFFKPLKTNEYRYEKLVDVKRLEENGSVVVKASSNIKGYSESHILESLVDLDDFNGFHSLVSDTSFPAEFIFEYDEYKSFNTFEIYALRNEWNPRGLPKDIEIYISDDGTTYDLIYEGETLHQSVNKIKLDKSYNTKLVKLIVLSSHRENYIGIGEIKLSNSFNNGKIINAYNSNVKLSKNFSFVYGESFNNSYALESNKGILKYSFEGNNIALFSKIGPKYGSMEVRVNKGEWLIVNLYNEEEVYSNLVFSVFDLDKSNNVIEVRSLNKDLINIDYFVVG